MKKLKIAILAAVTTLTLAAGLAHAYVEHSCNGWTHQYKTGCCACNTSK